MMRNSKMRRRHSCTGLALKTYEHPLASTTEDKKSARWQFLKYLQSDVIFPATGSITVSCGRYQNVLARFDFPLVSSSSSRRRRRRRRRRRYQNVLARFDFALVSWEEEGRGGGGGGAGAGGVFTLDLVNIAVAA